MPTCITASTVNVFNCQDTRATSRRPMHRQDINVEAQQRMMQRERETALGQWVCDLHLTNRTSAENSTLAEQRYQLGSLLAASLKWKEDLKFPDLVAVSSSSTTNAGSSKSKSCSDRFFTSSSSSSASSASSAGGITPETRSLSSREGDDDGPNLSTSSSFLPAIRVDKKMKPTVKMSQPWKKGEERQSRHLPRMQGTGCWVSTNTATTTTTPSQCRRSPSPAESTSVSSLKSKRLGDLKQLRRKSNEADGAISTKFSTTGGASTIPLKKQGETAMTKILKRRVKKEVLQRQLEVQKMRLERARWRGSQLLWFRDVMKLLSSTLQQGGTYDQCLSLVKVRPLWVEQPSVAGCKALSSLQVD